jgi:hypothetical protein
MTTFSQNCPRCGQLITDVKKARELHERDEQEKLKLADAIRTELERDQKKRLNEARKAGEAEAAEKLAKAERDNKALQDSIEDRIAAATEASNKKLAEVELARLQEREKSKKDLAKVQREYES